MIELAGKDGDVHWMHAGTAAGAWWLQSFTWGGWGIALIRFFRQQHAGCTL